ncbi:MAG: DoxX family protein [Chitinophagales bacterium]
MQKNKIIYWTTTAIVSLMMLFSAYNYFTNEEMKAGFVHLGFPNYFRIELAVAKILGALILLIPVFPKQVKEFAYSGFIITFVSAFIAHVSSSDPISIAIMPLAFLVILLISYIYYQKKLSNN